MSLDILLSSFPPGIEEQLIIQNSGLSILEIIASRSPQIFLEADDILIHKFNVKISGLLKSKSPICRWFGAYLAKISIDASPLILKSHGSIWGNILIHILELPEPPVTYQITIQALSSIFSNTVGKSELTREITTPRLPSYLKLVLNKLKDIIKNGGNGNILLSPIIQSMTQILRQQSTSFRPFSSGFHTCLLELLIQSINSPANISDDLLQDICTAYVCLHMSATKGTEAEEWRTACLSVINEIHLTTDQLATKYVREDGNNSGSRSPLLNLPINVSEHTSPLVFSRRFQVLFTLLKSFLTTPTKISVKLPVGAVENLCDRLYSISRYTTKQPALDKSQYTAFLSVMDKVHINLALLNTSLLPIVGNSILEHFDMLLHHISTLSDGAKNQTVQLVLLQLTSKLLVQVSIVPKSYLQTICRLVQSATSLVNDQSISNRYQQLSDFISNPKAFSRPTPAYVTDVVNEFFISVLNSVPDLPLNIRAEIDRYFILSNNSRGLNVSSLYPGNLTRYSVAPMAVRVDNGVGLATSLLHPRLPPLAVSTQNLIKSATLDPSGRNGVEHGEDDDEREGEEYDVSRNQKASEPVNSMEVDEVTAPVAVAPTPIVPARRELPTPIISNRVPEPVVLEQTSVMISEVTHELVDDVVPVSGSTLQTAIPLYAPESDSDDDIEIPINIDSDSDEEM